MFITRGGVFGKQARFVLAEFLLFVLVFPGVHACVGLTSGYARFSCYWCGVAFPSVRVVNCRWLVRSELHVCGGREAFLLLLVLTGSFPGFVGGPNSW